MSREPIWRRPIARLSHFFALNSSLTGSASALSGASLPDAGASHVSSHPLAEPGDQSQTPSVKPQRDWTPWIFALIALAALVLRLYGLNWDANNHLHPDEREIILRAMCLNFPGQARSPNCDPAYTGPGWFFSIASPLNPHFFAYGSFPLYLLAAVSHGLAWITQITHGAFHPTDGGAFDDYNHFALVGRTLSALFDTGSVVVGGLIGRRLAGRWAGLLAAALIAAIPFEVQVSHFYAVDTPTLFFILLTLWACVALAQFARRPAALEHKRLIRESWVIWGFGAVAGAAFALAVASKVSALPLLAPIVFAAVLVWRRRGLESGLLALAGAGFAAIAVFLITSPYVVIDWRDFIAQVNEQTMLSQGKLDYPYVRQFAGTTPFVYQIQQLLLYDMGLPLGLLGLAGFAWAVSRVWRRWNDEWTLLVVWIVPYFAIIGSAYTKFTRYMLPVFAPLAICGAAALVALARWGMAQAAAPESERNPAVRALMRRVAALRRPAWWRGLAIGLAVVTLGSALLASLALDNIYSAPNTRVQASEWIYNHVAPGAVVTSEVWDDSLPVMVPPARVSPEGIAYTSAGHPINPGQYGQIGLNLYDQDTSQKADQLATSLASANVVVISSQRLLKSIPKLPDRYPMTIRYYQLLFAGKLGFHLAAHFDTQPHIFGLTWNDSGADESFSVYDHPPVWIFTRDGNGLSAAQIRTELTQGIDFSTVTSRSGSQKSLLLSPQDAAADQQAAPLAVQFPAGSLANRIPVIWWLVVVELLGMVSFPLTFFVFRGLADRGWGFSKLLGLLLLAWVVWFPSSLRLLPFTAWAVSLGFALVTLAGGLVAWRRREELWAFFKARWRLVVAGEALFLAAFLAFTWIRALDPDLWHIYRGGEKPMELAFLNAILRSTYMPPYDPWFSGGAINYYYYGQYLIATLIKLTGVTPTTAFNLAIPLLFAVTCAGAFSVVAGLTRRWWAGLAGGIAVAVVSNLDGLWQLIHAVLAVQAGRIPAPFDYWASSRVIPYTINEFPFWSFLYADLHAHVIDLPIMILVVGLGGSLLMRARRDGGRLRPALPTLGAGALALGAAWCVNTWDVPVITILLVTALTLRLLPFGASASHPWRRLRERVTWPVVRMWALGVVGVVGAAYVLYLPFHATFQNFTSGIGTVTTPTDPGQFATLFGIWLFLIITFYAVELRDRLAPRFDDGAAGDDALADEMPYALPTWAIGVIVLGAVVLAASISLKVALVLLLALGVYLALDLRHSPVKLMTYVLSLLGLAIALGVEVIYIRDFLDGGAWERMNTVFKFYYEVWVCFSLSGALIFAQVVGRVLGLTQPVGRGSRSPLAVGSRAKSPFSYMSLAFRIVWLAAFIALLNGSLVFDALGTRARVNDPSIWAAVQPPPGGVQPQGLSLDGMAYMKGWYPEDYAAIQWLNAHVSGSPTIVEASAGPYQWYSRVSIYTGLPDVLGWGSHEQQQRYPDQVFARQNAVQDFYLTTDPTSALQFLRDYNVRYVYVGELERSCITTGANGACVPLPAQSLQKFTTLTQGGYLTPVFQDGGTTIYRVGQI